MGSFIVILCATGLVNGAIGMISPDGELKKYVRLVGALCILLAMVAPIYESVVSGELDLDNYFSDMVEKEEQYKDVYAEYLADGSRKEAEAMLEASICEKFNLKSDDIAVKAELVRKGDGYALDRIGIYVSGSAILRDPRELVAYVEELAECECEVIYGKGGE